MSSVFNICGGENASYTPPKKGGGETPSEPMKDVNFIDYDGKIVASYTADEFASLSAMPDNPSHEGLVAQGWNWSFEDAQEYVAENGKLVVGQMYVTESGDTEIDITLREGRLEPVLGIAPNGTVEIDWGDGSAVDIVTGTSLDTNVDTQHFYESEGNYTIKLHVTDGNFAVSGDSSKGCQLLHKADAPSNEWRIYQGAIKAIRIGENTKIESYAFFHCYLLVSVTMPKGITTIGSYAFNDCALLVSATMPDSVTSIGGSISYVFYNCVSLVLVALPNGITSIESSMFYGCHSLVLITIPSSVTNINGFAIGNCISLTTVTIPSSVTSIDDNAFSYNYGIKWFILKSATPPKLSNSNAFANEATDRIFIVPNGTLQAYKTASNWSTYASAMQEASA